MQRRTLRLNVHNVHTEGVSHLQVLPSSLPPTGQSPALGPPHAAAPNQQV